MKYTTSLFIQKSNRIHKNKYDYSKSAYVNQETKTITFDVIVDFKDKNSAAVIEEIKKNLVDKFPEYHFYIVEDKDFSD